MCTVHDAGVYAELNKTGLQPWTPREKEDQGKSHGNDCGTLGRHDNRNTLKWRPLQSIILLYVFLPAWTQAPCHVMRRVSNFKTVNFIGPLVWFRVWWEREWWYIAATCCYGHPELDSCLVAQINCHHNNKFLHWLMSIIHVTRHRLHWSIFTYSQVVVGHQSNQLDDEPNRLEI